MDDAHQADTPEAVRPHGSAPDEGALWAGPFVTPLPPGAPGTFDPSADPPPHEAMRRGRRWPKVAAAVGVAAGVGVGAAVIAAAATSGSSTPESATTAASGSADPSSSAGTPSPPAQGSPPMPGGGRHMGMGGGPGMGGMGLGGGVVHGQFSVAAPGGGYETLQLQTGTVSSISNTAGSTWSLVVKSADGTSWTYIVDSGTSVDGGETGVSAIASGDTVRVLAVVSNGTATAKQVTDRTVTQKNGQSWAPEHPAVPGQAPSGSGPGSGTPA